MADTDKTLLLECSCLSTDHVVIVRRDDWDQMPELTIHVRMRPDLGFFRRIAFAVKILFRPSACGYGSYGESFVRCEDAVRLQRMLRDFITDSRCDQGDQYAKNRSSVER